MSFLQKLFRPYNNTIVIGGYLIKLDRSGHKCPKCFTPSFPFDKDGLYVGLLYCPKCQEFFPEPRCMSMYFYK